MKESTKVKGNLLEVSGDTCITSVVFEEKFACLGNGQLDNPLTFINFEVGGIGFGDGKVTESSSAIEGAIRSKLSGQPFVIS